MEREKFIDPTENTTPLPSDADAYAAADEQFELDEDRARSLRHAPIIRRDIPIIAEDMLSDNEFHELMELRIMQSYVDELDYNNADIP